jgi:GNAT superfamily N-acetyltransferase
MLHDLSEGMTSEIRAARLDDLDALLLLYHHLNPADPPLPRAAAEDRLRTMLAQPGMTVLCAQAGGTVVATCTLIVAPNLTRGGASYAFIENVVTHPGNRQNGHGRAVVRKAIDMAFDAGCYKVMLLTGRADPMVHQFYQGCGFIQNKTGFQIRRDGF